MSNPALKLAYFFCITFGLTTLSFSDSDTPDPQEQMSADDTGTNDNTDDQSSDMSIPGTIRDISSADLVAEMGVGWNLGNSLDVESRDKTDWGNPLPSQAIVDKVIEMGFTTLRVPITWSYHQSSSAPFTIESTYLDRVQEVVNYVYKGICTLS